jgi:hypothetical protein
MAQEETMGQICDYFRHDVQRQCTVLFVILFTVQTTENDSTLTPTT